MIIDFRQGIIAYPTSSGLQRFLEFADGFVGINAADGRTDVTFANGDENYLHNETVSIQTAWGPIAPNVDAWLYWNLNGLTAQRTFGVTYVQPVVSASAPTAPVNDLHWFDTTNNIMRVYTSGKWVTRIRTFACKINNATISPMGSGVINRPFAGTQVGIQGVNIPVGRIIVDAQGQPIRKQNGQLFTTEDEFFINGSPINTIRLEANVFQAQAVENIAKYQPVKFVDFGKVALATYNDTYTTTIAMAMEDIIGGDVGTLCMQGVISSPDWNWPAVGKPLWIHGSIPGLLVDYDPHVQSAGTYKVAKPPVGRVISRSSIFFDQGLGGKGDKGDAGDADVPLATTTVFGISKLSVDAADPANPIVVGDNDPRNFNDRYPLPHNQAATTIIPSPTGILTGVNLQANLQIINDSFVKRAGDSMTGYLVLSADPAQDMHAATKHYVDTRPLNSLADVTISNPVANEILKYDGTGWVNGESAGGPDLWMVSSRTDTIPWVPATASVTFIKNDGYNTAFTATQDILDFPVGLLNVTVPSLYIQIEISGITYTDTIADPSVLSTVQDVVDYVNTSTTLSPHVTASFGVVDGHSGIVFKSKNAGENVSSVQCGPLEYAALETALNLCDYAYAFSVQDSAGEYVSVMEIYECATNLPISDFQTLAIEMLGFNVQIALNVDGVLRSYRFTPTDMSAVSIGQVIDICNAQLGNYATFEASGKISGITVTSVQNTVTDLSIILTPFFASSTLSQVTTPVPNAGTPYTAIVIDPILTPSPHVPPYDEVYVPLHTVIDSDPPSLYIPFWMDAIGSGARISCMRSIGKIAIGAPGSADNIYRSEPTLYSVGSYWNTTANQSGVVVSVHHVDGEQPGHLITTGGYKGRVIVPLISHGYGLNAKYAIGCGIGVGNANGGVYVLTSYMANTGWYSSAEGIVILTCFDPTLATVTWCKTYQINSTDSDTVSATQSVAGFVVNPITNISYIALETVRTYVDGDGNALSDIGMSVIAVNGSGNTLWHRHMKALNASNVATTYAPASIAVHNESGDVVVSCGNTVVKLSGSSGNTIWATQHTTIEFDTHGAVLHDIAVDQSTGDVYVTAYQSLQLG